jgi:hypothetical protein
MGQVAKLKKSLLRMRLPGKLMFLFRIRIGLYAVLARIGAKMDWIELEEELADTVSWKQGGPLRSGLVGGAVSYYDSPAPSRNPSTLSTKIPGPVDIAAWPCPRSSSTRLLATAALAIFVAACM